MMMRMALIWVMGNAWNCCQHTMQMESLRINFGWSWISLPPHDNDHINPARCSAMPDIFNVRSGKVMCFHFFWWFHDHWSEFFMMHWMINLNTCLVTIPMIMIWTVTMVLILNGRTNYNTLVKFCFFFSVED